ncbi:hypothetical protein [Amycolatopsis pigmentata]|uniref:Flagellar basal body-associated protein FliL n=1 Tax=Amycolatopsis pigmentata TaxID=450801 RepID=A0ABW5FST4_9PSEU
MSWQEELRRLDSELARGRISRHEHRKQRDELLAAASGGAAPSPVAAPLAPTGTPPRGFSGWQSANPGSGTAAPEPAPAEQPAEVAQPAEESPQEQTGTSAALLASERPTSAPSPADERPTESMRYPSMAEAPTVITRPVRAEETPSLIPPMPRHSSGVVRQPSVPVWGKPRGHGPTWLFLSLGVLLVLGLIIGATFLFGGSKTDNAAPAPGSAVANPQLDVEGKLPELPGTPNPNNSTMSVDKAAQMQIISATDVPKVKASGAQEVVYRASAETAQPDAGYMMVAIPTASAEDAGKLVKGLRETLINAGFRADPLGRADADTAYTGSNSTGRVTALWYASGPVVIGIGVSQPLTANPASLHTRITQVHDSLATTLPAG